MRVKNLTLEISLKPFFDLSDNAIESVCRKCLSQWRRLAENADTVSIMFWTSDGSELLDYKGSLDDTFEWDKFIGVANPEVYGPPLTDVPAEHQSIHRLPRLYRENPPEMRYSDLKRIIDTMRRTFTEAGFNTRVGTTFDPGPEFARSSFKYQRHPEILMANTLGGKSFVCCYAKLNADNTPYAGFPDGIPQDTPLGTFLGRQSRIFCKDLGFDYIWMSNGFGFGLETWGVCGAVFDGESFDSSSCSAIKDKIFHFWTSFRKECPDLPIETRGTNLATAMDLSSDAVPLREIYQQVSDLTPPPNSPWAALNGDFGAEMAGWMSHIAEVPDGKGFPFRFYTHDPWFINSPWLDRYGRNPHDIYLPLSVSRIDKSGKLMTPNSVSLLTLDDSLGNMPDQVPDEVIPHILHALRNSPDQPGPLVWLYPFDEYHDMTFAGKNVDEVFFGDWFIRSAVNAGLPLNCVVSTTNFANNPQSVSDGNIIVAPTVAARSGRIFEMLRDFVSKGGKILLYGPANDPRLLELLGLSAATGINGELSITGKDISGKFIHNPVYSGGDMSETAVDAVTLASACDDLGNTRAAATVRALPQWSGGAAAWVRGTNSFTIGKNGRYPNMLDREQLFHPEELMSSTLARLGFVLASLKHCPGQQNPVYAVKRHDNGLYLSSYIPDITVRQLFRFPEGAPVFTQTEAMIVEGQSSYQLPKAGHYECRVFIDMPDGVVKVREACPAVPGIRRRLEISGLKNATLRFRPENDSILSTTLLVDPKDAPFTQGDFRTPEIESAFGGTVLTFRNLNNKILISW